MNQVDCLDKEPIFVIGYPKSGNTWLARLTSDALDSPMVGGDNPIHQADKKQSYAGEFVIYKAHYTKKDKPDYITEYSKIFYIVRDFRDILISGYFYNNSIHDESRVLLRESKKFDINMIYRLYFNHQIRRMIKKWTSHELTVFFNLINRKKDTLGNWSNHVNYWMEFPNVCIVKYEDLLNDTYNILKILFNKIEINCSEGRLVEAIERQSFNRRKREFEERGDRVNVRFLRKGVSGDWKRFLDERMLELIKQSHGVTMNKLGYEI